jgi:uncharacterized phage-associated protein
MSNLSFQFQFDRSLQAAAYLLNQAYNHEMKYIHLLKMLYIADREYLVERGYPLTGDKVVAMQHGPVLVHVYRLIKGMIQQAESPLVEKWHQFIQTPPRAYKVRLISDPGTGDLSKVSMAKLDSVFERFGNLQPFEVVQLTHEFQEWQKYFQCYCREVIPWQAILRAQNADDMVQVAEKQIILQRHQNALQARCQ